MLLICILQSIPPVARMSMADGKWVTVLCRKLKDWWHLVCDFFIVKNNFVLGVVLHLVNELNKAWSSGCRRQSTNRCLTWVSSVRKQFLAWIPCTIEYWMTYCFSFLRVEIETYKELEPATRLMILKAICDIRCEVCAPNFRVEHLQCWQWASQCYVIIWNKTHIIGCLSSS